MGSKKIARSISIEQDIWEAGVAEAHRKRMTMTQLIREYLVKFIPAVEAGKETGSTS